MASLGLQFSCHNYGDSDRQEVAVWEWTNKPSAGGYWLVYALPSVHPSIRNSP